MKGYWKKLKPSWFNQPVKLSGTASGHLLPLLPHLLSSQCRPAKNAYLPKCPIKRMKSNLGNNEPINPTEPTPRTTDQTSTWWLPRVRPPPFQMDQSLDTSLVQHLDPSRSPHHLQCQCQCHHVMQNITLWLLHWIKCIQRVWIWYLRWLQVPQVILPEAKIGYHLVFLNERMQDVICKDAKSSSQPWKEIWHWQKLTKKYSSLPGSRRAPWPGKPLLFFFLASSISLPLLHPFPGLLESVALLFTNLWKN